MKTESTFRPVLWLMSGRALGQAAAFLIPVVLVRKFDPALFGSYKRLFLLYATLFGVAQLGFAESLYYFLPKFPDRAGKLAVNGMLGLGISGVLCLIALTIFRVPIARGLGDVELASLVPWVGLFIGPMLVSAVLEIAMVSIKAPGEAAVAYMASDLVRAAALVLPALIFVSLRALLVGAVIFAFVRLAATVAYVWKRLSNVRPDWPLMKQQLGYALPFALAVAVDIVQQNYHQYIVSNRFDATTFAIYSVALLQVPLVDQTATTTSSVAMVQMGEAMGQGREDDVRILWHDCVYKLSIIFFPLVALLMVTSGEIITVLFTDRYAAAVPLFRISSLGILFFALQTDTILRVLAETRFLFVLNLLRLGVIAVMIGPCITRFHLIGAVIATLASVGFARVVALVRIKQLQKVPVSELLPWRRLGTAAGVATAAGFAAYVARAALPLPALARLIAACLVFGIAYLGLGRLFGMIPAMGPGGWLSWIRGSNSPAAEPIESPRTAAIAASAPASPSIPATAVAKE